MIGTTRIANHRWVLALVSCALAGLIAVPAAEAAIIFEETFNDYTGFPVSGNDLGGHQTNFGVPTLAEGADSGDWLAGRFEAFDNNPISNDVGVLKFGNGSSSPPYNHPAGRVDDDAGLVARIDLTNYTDVELAFDWRTFSTDTSDRFVVAYYVGDGLGTPNNAYDWFNDPLFGNGDMSGSDPNGQANSWYLANWVEVHRGTSPGGFQQESGISIPGGDVIYLAFWLDNGDGDLGKFDNVVVSGNVVPEPSAWLLGAIALGSFGILARRRRRR